MQRFFGRREIKSVRTLPRNSGYPPARCIMQRRGQRVYADVRRWQDFARERDGSVSSNNLILHALRLACRGLSELPMSVMNAIAVESRYVRLRFAVTLGSFLDEWRVVWVGGWDKSHVFYLALVERCELSRRPGKN